MNIENSILLRGGKEISDKILKFMNSLIIKNQQEADACETNESFNHYEKLKKCISGITDFDDHVFTSDDLPIEFSNYDRKALNIELSKGNEKLQELIQELRDEFINNYIDKNLYYTVLSGNPKPNQTIHIIDRDNVELKEHDVTDIINEFDYYNVNNGPLTLYDISKTSFPNFYNYLYKTVNGKKNITLLYGITKTLPLHRIRFVSNPRTYNALFIDGLLDEILEKTGYEYVKCMKYKLDIHRLRSAEHFDILWYNPNILDDYTTNSFFGAYQSVREFVFRNKYIKTLEEMYKHYSNFELMIILFGTFQRLCNSFIERYSVRNYTDKEIYDILDSHNLSVLKSVSIKILRRIVEDLDSLLSYRGTEEVLSKLMKIVSKDTVMSVKRYDLVKRFNTDNVGKSILTPDKPYNANVDLAFVDRTILSTGNSLMASKSDSQVIGYEEFVSKDPTWGMSGKYESDTMKLEAVRNVKNKLLRMEFNRMDTKYIGVTTIIDLYRDYNHLISKIGLLIQHFGGFNVTKINSIKYQFEGINLTPFQLFTLVSAANRYIKAFKDSSITNHDIIESDCFSYSKVMKLNTIPFESTLEIVMGLQFEPYYSKNRISEMPAGEARLMIEGGHKLRVSDILKSRDVRDHIICFETTTNDFSEIMSQYEINYERLNNLIYKSMETSDYEVAMAWKTIRDYFVIDLQTSDYSLPATFSSYFESFGGEVLALFENKIKNTTTNSLEVFIKYVTKAFVNSISDLIQEEKDSVNQDVDVKMSKDLSLLIDAFASLYVELRDVTVNYNLTDYPYNAFQIMDRAYASEFTRFRDRVDLSYEFSIYEYQKVVEHILFREMINPQMRLSYIEECALTDKYSLGHINRYRSRYDLIEFCGIESRDKCSDSLTFTENVRMEDI